MLVDTDCRWLVVVGWMVGVAAAGGNTTTAAAAAGGGNTTRDTTQFYKGLTVKIARDTEKSVTKSLSVTKSGYLALKW